MLKAVGVILWLVCLVFALRGKRWAYAVFILLALFWIPGRTAFHFHHPPCEMLVPWNLAFYSLANYKHIVLFGLFFLMTWVQLRNVPYALLWAFLATIAVGVLIELEEGATGTGHCRLRDLIPDSAGALVGGVIASVWRRRRPVVRSDA